MGFIPAAACDCTAEAATFFTHGSLSAHIVRRYAWQGGHWSICSSPELANRGPLVYADRAWSARGGVDFGQGWKALLVQVLEREHRACGRIGVL